METSNFRRGTSLSLIVEYSHSWAGGKSGLVSRCFSADMVNLVVLHHANWDYDLVWVWLSLCERECVHYWMICVENREKSLNDEKMKIIFFMSVFFLPPVYIIYQCSRAIFFKVGHDEKRKNAKENFVVFWCCFQNEATSFVRVLCFVSFHKT